MKLVALPTPISNSRPSPNILKIQWKINAKRKKNDLNSHANRGKILVSMSLSPMNLKR